MAGYIHIEYVEWSKKCLKLIGWEDKELPQIADRVFWFDLYRRGATPEQAIAKFKKKDIK